MKPRDIIVDYGDYRVRWCWDGTRYRLAGLKRLEEGETP